MFETLSFRFKDAWASLILPEGSVSQNVTRNGKKIEDKRNVFLGVPDQVSNVSVLQDDNTYKRTAMFNRTILSAITESREEYMRSIAV